MYSTRSVIELGNRIIVRSLFFRSILRPLATSAPVIFDRIDTNMSALGLISGWALLTGVAPLGCTFGTRAGRPYFAYVCPPDVTVICRCPDRYREGTIARNLSTLAGHADVTHLRVFTLGCFAGAVGCATTGLTLMLAIRFAQFVHDRFAP